jgi:hypothetical protein
MAKHEPLTHEHLKGLFESNFKLANKVIELARFYVKAGEEVNVDELLEQIYHNPQQHEVELLVREEELREAKERE